MNLQIIVIVTLCFGVSLGRIAQLCRGTQVLKDVRIPISHTFRQTEFDEFVLDSVLKETYILLPSPPPFPPGTNYNCKIIKNGDTTYQRVCTTLNPNCTEFNFTLTMASRGGKISFPFRDPNNAVVIDFYWSPCPSKFILRMQCSSESIKKNNKCAITGARMTVFLVGDINLSNAPWNDISKEIFTATGVRFGDIEGMTWYYTENTGTPCEV